MAKTDTSKTLEALVTALTDFREAVHLYGIEVADGYELVDGFAVDRVSKAGQTLTDLIAKIIIPRSDRHTLPHGDKLIAVFRALSAAAGSVDRHNAGLPQYMVGDVILHKTMKLVD